MKIYKIASDIAKASWLRHLRQFPASYAECPKEFKNLPVFKDTHKSGWMDLININPYQYNSCPEELKDSPDILEAWHNTVRRLIKNDPSIFPFMSIEDYEKFVRLFPEDFGITSTTYKEREEVENVEL